MTTQKIIELIGILSSLAGALGILNSAKSVFDAINRHRDSMIRLTDKLEILETRISEFHSQAKSDFDEHRKQIQDVQFFLSKYGYSPKE